MHPFIRNQRPFDRKPFFLSRLNNKRVACSVGQARAVRIPIAEECQGADSSVVFKILFLLNPHNLTTALNIPFPYISCYILIERTSHYMSRTSAPAQAHTLPV
jgi:hypothetical protein